MTCRATNASVSCAHRRLAVIRGRFKWVSGHGWVWLDSIRPGQTWERCPWCWGVLPDLDEVRVRHVQGLLANGYPYEGEGPEE